AYGIVWKAADRRTGEIVAVKKIFDAFRNRTDAQVRNHCLFPLQEFGKHPNIIKLLDVIPAQNDQDIYLIFESMETDLHAVIKKGNVLKDAHKSYILYQILKATKFIHSGNVIHRDQKPSNILLDAECFVKLCDFGLARSLAQLREEEEAPALTEYVATRWYRAPEILLSSQRYTKGVDMWSIGCILGELLLGKPLFPGTSTVNQIEQILRVIPAPSPEDLLALQSHFRASVLSHITSRQRITFEEMLPPSTPQPALDLLKKLLVFNPDKRLTAEEALQHPYVRRFHCPAREPSLDHDVILPLGDDIQLSVAEYRSKLYEVLSLTLFSQILILWVTCSSASYRILEGGREKWFGVRVLSLKNKNEFKRLNLLKISFKVFDRREAINSAGIECDASPGAVIRNPSPSAPHKDRISKTRRVGRQIPQGNAQTPPQTVQNICNVKEVLVFIPHTDVQDPSYSPAEEKSLSPSYLSRVVRGFHSEVSISLTPLLCLAQHPGHPQVPRKDPRPLPKPSRRMFQISANVGAAGDPRASMGSYSQAYGTISKSALQNLPISKSSQGHQQ
ncbi:Mitogen-activated protein kinase 15, partial [Calypte anna]